LFSYFYSFLFFREGDLFFVSSFKKKGTKEKKSLKKNTSSLSCIFFLFSGFYSSHPSCLSVFSNYKSHQAKDFSSCSAAAGSGIRARANGATGEHGHWSRGTTAARQQQR
jgi:hypothetical protein